MTTLYPSKSQLQRKNEPVGEVTGLDDQIFMMINFLIAVPLMHKFCTFWGLAIFIGVLQLKKWLIEKIFRLEALQCMDYIFLHDCEKSRGNILCKVSIVHD